MQNQRVTRIAWLIVLLHAVISTAHGVAHYGLGITLSAFQSGYVLVVISIGPILAAALLWAKRTRLGFFSLVLSMAGALIFGGYWHYLAVSPDNVFHLHEGNLETLFSSTAALLMVSELSGVAVGLWGFRYLNDQTKIAWAMLGFLLISFAALTPLCVAQSTQTNQALISPEVHSDNRITFRLRAPNAVEVSLNREGAKPVSMQKDQQGAWSVTVGPLEPDFYGYSFLVDGVTMFDPSNRVTKFNFIYTANVVHVPGDSSLPWEVNSVPHGAIHRHFYRSGIVGDERDYYVYLPPGYDEKAKKLYPVLYLLHGYSDDASAWTAVGRAHVIFDNLIAQGKVKPMIVVMPLGYGAPEIVKPGAGLRDANLRQRNYDRFRDALLGEVQPQVEKVYRVAKDRNSRAIAGLSMGGAESLYVGLNALDRFAWIGAFSSGGLSEDFNATFPRIDAKANAQLRLLWIACGTDDGLIGTNRKLREWLKTKDVRHVAVETPGAHVWMLWRRNLAEFAALLFR